MIFHHSNLVLVRELLRRKYLDKKENVLFIGRRGNRRITEIYGFYEGLWPGKNPISGILETLFLKIPLTQNCPFYKLNLLKI